MNIEELAQDYYEWVEQQQKLWEGNDNVFLFTDFETYLKSKLTKEEPVDE